MTILTTGQLQPWITTRGRAYVFASDLAGLALLVGLAPA